MIHFTNSKGERLPDDINKVANERYDGKQKPDIDNELSLNIGFYWPNTIEKREIWLNVYLGKYNQFYLFHNTYEIKQARKAEIIAEIEKLQNELKEI